MKHVLPKATQSQIASDPTSSLSSKADAVLDAESPVARVLEGEIGMAPRQRLQASRKVVLMILGVGMVATVAWAVGLSVLFLKAVWWLCG